jgi:tRNA-dihydrouridine synthase
MQLGEEGEGEGDEDLAAAMALAGLPISFTGSASSCARRAGAPARQPSREAAADCVGGFTSRAARKRRRWQAALAGEDAGASEGTQQRAVPPRCPRHARVVDAAHVPVGFPVTYVAAPLVGASDLAFRTLCAQHGAQLLYTEMLDVERFVTCAVYRDALFFSQLPAGGAPGVAGQAVPIDVRTGAAPAAAPPAAAPAAVGTAAVGTAAVGTAAVGPAAAPAAVDVGTPLLAQFGGNNPEAFVAAAALVAPHVCGVDVNLGCPQAKAKDAGFGAYLLDRPKWPIVQAIVRGLAAALHPLGKLVTCKIRLCDTLQDTLDLAQLLEACGCDLLAVHGRTRGSVRRRRAGAADLQAIRAVVAAVGHRIPVLTNGNVRRGADVVANIQATGCDGAMVGEALLAYPALFAGLPAVVPCTACAHAGVGVNNLDLGAGVDCAVDGAADVADDGAGGAACGAAGGRAACSDGAQPSSPLDLCPSSAVAVGAEVGRAPRRFAGGATFDECLHGANGLGLGGIVVAAATKDEGATGAAANARAGTTSRPGGARGRGAGDADTSDGTDSDGSHSDADWGAHPNQFSGAGGIGRGAGCDEERKLVAPLAREYLSLAAAHPPPLFEYARRHVGYLLQRRGLGTRTYFRLAGPMKTADVRARLLAATCIA